MQVTGEKDTEYTPVVYKIANESNAERQRLNEMHRRRVIRKAVDEVWSDPYHPELCEDICYKTYQQAIGLMPYHANNPDCICSDEDIETIASCSCDDVDVNSDSSSDVEWEIQFSPPNAHC
ncbi:hypothetical protein O3G_MSEX000316 [Manduca sexta]|nr:hypothetical protein O3G_MSEX000316 [Manduca sexta]